MLGDGIINQTALGSPILSTSTLNPQGGLRKKNLMAAVILTSLIDAFSILVIYLLVNFSNSGEILYISQGMELPQAKTSVALKRTTLVKLENGKLFLEDKELNRSSLVGALIDIRKKLTESALTKEDQEYALTVQADKHVKYKFLNDIVQAGSQAGFSEIKFAVLAD